MWNFSPAGGETHTIHNYAAWAGVDAAMWDVIGKAKNLPVYKLLATDNEPNPHIRMYASGGVEYAWYKRPEDLIDEAVRHKEEGYTAFKFRLGTEWKNSGMTMKKYVPYLYKMREAVGPKFDLMQEANMRLTLEEALELCPVLEELKFLWFEEPINSWQEGAIEGYIRIREALPTVMVSGGESLGMRFDFKPWIDRDAYDIVQPDCNQVGVTEAWHIARIGQSPEETLLPAQLAWRLNDHGQCGAGRRHPQSPHAGTQSDLQPIQRGNLQRTLGGEERLHGPAEQARVRSRVDRGRGKEVSLPARRRMPDPIPTCLPDVSLAGLGAYSEMLPARQSRSF